MKKLFSFLVGAMMGALVGSTAAILLAPSSGDDLRDELVQRVENFKNDIIAASDNKRIELETQLANLRNPNA
jgi:gas vesicle protein